jgi:hypothetical protein
MRRALIAIVSAAVLAGGALAGGAATTGGETSGPALQSAQPAPGGAQQEGGGQQARQIVATSCVLCHADGELFEPEELAIIVGFRDDVHAQVGLSCHDCHGGNPDPELFEDYVDAKDEEFAANPYRGMPDPADVPSFCGTCHSDYEYMRRFDPDAIVDQEREYATSRHGQALATGDTNVAMCTSCHGIHGIRRVTDPQSSVYPTRVAETCAGCHADVERMGGYMLANGQPLPVDQFARWQESVHAAAMFESEDLSAPTCNDCHGNHGAAPPELDSIAFVCGQCHGREAELFRNSPKRAGFEEHNEYLVDAEGDGCIACHDPPEPAAEITDVTSFGECASCHGNHGVVRPTLAFLSPLPDTPCAFCHADTDDLAVHFPESEEQVREHQRSRDGLLRLAEELGLYGEERYDWLVDQAEMLPPHTLGPGDTEGQPGQRRPEFDRLFTKFRIGKTSYTFRDPATGELTRVPILRCASCHADSETLGNDAVGLGVAEQLLGHMLDLTSKTARAERVLLSARRGGVHTGGAAMATERAIDAQIDLEVLLHTFSAAENSEFVEAHAEGIAHADVALAAGAAALEELVLRRQGLAIALGLIVLVLIGLALKIREVSERDVASYAATRSDTDTPRQDLSGS